MGDFVRGGCPGSSSGGEFFRRLFVRQFGVRRYLLTASWRLEDERVGDGDEQMADGRWTLCGKLARGSLKLRFIAAAGAQACVGCASVRRRRMRKHAEAEGVQACGALLTGVTETNINI